MTDFENYRVLVVDEDQRLNQVYREGLNFEDMDVDVESSLEEVNADDYDTLITDFIGDETYESFEEFEDVIIYSANDPEIMDVPKERYVQKGSGLDGLKEKLYERVSLHQKLNLQ